MKTLVYGLGESGVSAARALIDRGEEVIVADSDDSERTRGIVDSLGVEGHLGTGSKALEGGVDRVVASPLVRPRNPMLVAAEDEGIPVLSEVALGLELLGPGVRTAAVTGTNGKTTVVGMLHSILAASNVPHAVAGNSWRALTGCLEEVREAGVLVLELSSFQLHYLPEPGFEVAMLLNVKPDHLNWHDSMEEYAADKLRIFEGQGPTDLVLVSANDPASQDATGSIVAETVVIGKGGTLVEGGRLLLRGRPLAEVVELSFVGPHNYENALFAAAAAERFGVGLEEVREGLIGYRIEPHRLETVAERDGVTYVDDSKATNPAAVAAALRSFGGTTVLILGGSEKETDFSEILPLLDNCRAIVCQGEAGPRIYEFLEWKGVPIDIFLAPDLSGAVEKARRFARPGDVVLLSPGCASFDQHAGYAERGAAFAKIVAEDVGGRTEQPDKGAVGQ
ncbi:MAG: UDP-N-acetylmuramoyl-L-alanine--D-glutamate ligase [Actinomycetota bacterium]|nr:UDP-N-acetylmuramoyl-L-alanine--D-glutamate ligase [Actinomycetota bacterium]